MWIAACRATGPESIVDPGTGVTRDVRLYETLGLRHILCSVPPLWALNTGARVAQAGFHLVILLPQLLSAQINSAQRLTSFDHY